MAKKNEKKIEYADWVEGVADSASALQALRANSRKEYFGIIDQCIAAVTELLTANAEPKPVE